MGTVDMGVGTADEVVDKGLCWEETGALEKGPIDRDLIDGPNRAWSRELLWPRTESLMWCSELGKSVLMSFM